MSRRGAVLLLGVLAACAGGEPDGAAAGVGLRPLDAPELAAEIRRRSREGPLVVNLWATWCPPCMAELPAFAAAARRHPEVSFLGASADWSLAFDERALEEDLARVEARWRELGMPFPSAYLVETELGALADALELPDAVLPWTLCYRDGRRVAMHSGELSAEALEALLASAFPAD